SEGSVQHEYALRFKRLIEERTNGEVEVVVYPYGTLGTSTHITEQLNMGVVEFAMASPGSLGKFIPEMQVFLLHFVLSQDDRTNQRILSDPRLIEDLDQLYAPKGLKLLSIYSEGEMVWTMKQRVRSPDDFGNVKMRVMTSPILLAAYDAYGASPTPMPYSEVYSALQLNMIDGQVNPIFAIERQKFHEVTSWMIFPGHTSFITTCAANRPFVETLPANHQAILKRTITELDEYIFGVQSQFQTERLKDILRDKKRKQSPLKVIGKMDRFVNSLSAEEQKELIDENPYLEFRPPLSEREIAAFRQASRDVRDVYLEIGGRDAPEVLARLLEATKAK
ncbi:MAG: TRAP transporter substrate-binding protein DctP, partial [Planctomycetales bacterium]|nr:TRAP transporter substrate-binding protein DctP [Planctomycetales bacterium]